jgi:GT2 family glycosyltransferase
MCKFSVIIVSYNNLKVICDCLDSIEKNNDIGQALQVIVVEQTPQNNIYEYLLSHYTNQIFTVVRNDNNGFGAGNNKGTEYANGDVILFLNPDTILVEPIFSFAINVFQNNKDIGLFGVQLLDAKGNLNLSYNEKINFGFGFILKNKMKRNRKFNGRKMYINGADLFVRKDIFIKSGMFDEKIFMYGEETDLCNRIIQQGYKIDYYGDHKIIHLEGQSTSFKEQIYERLCDSFIYVSDKHNYSWRLYFWSESIYYKIRLLFKLYKNDKEKEILSARESILSKKLQRQGETIQ